MTFLKSLIFPDGTSYSTSERVGDTWAIIAAPLHSDEIRQHSGLRASKTRSEALALEAAIDAPGFHIDKNQPLGDGSESLYSHAYLTGTTVFVAVDAENQVLDLDSDGAGHSSGVLVRTGVGIPDAILRVARARLARLRQDEADNSARAEPSSSIEETTWRVLRWCSAESKAQALMSKLDARPDHDLKLSIVQASTVGS
jgi:hypothetical protein